MPNIKEEIKAKLVAVEYAGVGSLPHFIIEVDGEYKSVPVRTGVNLLKNFSLKYFKVGLVPNIKLACKLIKIGNICS